MISLPIFSPSPSFLLLFLSYVFPFSLCCLCNVERDLVNIVKLFLFKRCRASSETRSKNNFYTMQINIENLFTRYHVHSHPIHTNVKSQFYIYINIYIYDISIIINLREIWYFRQSKRIKSH